MFLNYIVVTDVENNRDSSARLHHGESFHSYTTSTTSTGKS